MENKDYLKIGSAKDVKNFKDRLIYRFFEIMPGLMSWGALFLLILLTRYKPLWVSVFIIIFVIFWLFRTIYFSLHLWAGYKKMQEQEKINWIEKVKEIPGWENIYHLIVIPMYKESLEVIRDNFLNLLKSDHPKEKMIVVLAAEEKAKPETERAVKEIEKEFKNSFFKLLITWHPAHLPGEIAGKGSNETWAAKKNHDDMARFS